MVRAGKERGWHKDVNKSLNIKRVPPNRAYPPKKKQKVEKTKEKVTAKVDKIVEPKKEAPKQAASKKETNVVVKAEEQTVRKKTTKSASNGDPVQGILKLMADRAQVEVTDVIEKDVLKASGYSCRDSKKFREAYRSINKELGYVTRRTKNKAMVYSLTEAGRNHLLETGLLIVPAEPTSNEEYFEQLKAKLNLVANAPDGKLEAVFEVLEDGEWHSMQVLLSAAGYGSKDSKGFKSIMSGLRKLNLLEKENKGKNLRFSDIAFKFGRP